jgi:hypothetical protein
MWVTLSLLLFYAVGVHGDVFPEPGCYTNLGNGTCQQFWGWTSNSTGSEMFMVGGGQNYFVPNPSDRGQPGSFMSNVTFLDVFSTSRDCEKVEHWFLDATNSSSIGSPECIDACVSGDFVSIDPFYGTKADGLIIRLNTSVRTPVHVVIDLPTCIDVTQLRLFDCAKNSDSMMPSCSTSGIMDPMRISMNTMCLNRNPDTTAVVILVDHGLGSVTTGSTDKISLHMHQHCSMCNATTEFACDARRSVHRREFCGGICDTPLTDKEYHIASPGDDFAYDDTMVTYCSGTIEKLAAALGAGDYQRTAFRYVVSGDYKLNTTVTSAQLRFKASSAGSALIYVLSEVQKLFGMHRRFPRTMSMRLLT